MAKPDVRVRLSAEGVSEVVSALKRVQAEGQKSAKKQASGFGGLNRVLGGTTNLLGGLGIALGVHQFTRFIGNAIEAGDQINKLGAKVGASTENLSALSLVARTADSDLNQVGAALVRMNKNIGDAQAGIPTAAAALRDLNVKLEDLEGLDSVEIFELMSKRITALPTAIRQGRSAIQMFGRAGAMLMPTMRALAEEGLANVIKRAEELGVLIDHDLAAAAERIKDDVEILKMQGEALGVRFVAGFGPEMSQALQTISGDLKQTTSAWEEFGTGVGRVLKWLVSLVSTVFDTIGTYIGYGISALISGGKTIGRVLRGDLEGARREMETFNRFSERENKKFADRMKGRWELTLSAPTKATGTPEGGAGGETSEESLQQMAELAARRAQALQSSLDRELALVKTTAGLKNKAEQREFDQALQSVQTYYNDRRKIIEDAYAEQERILDEKQAALEDIVDPARREQEAMKIDTQRAQARIQYESDIADLIYEEQETVKDLAAERLGYEQQLLEMQGQRIAAERLGFDEQLRQYDELLKRQGVSDAERERAVARFKTALEAGADFEEAKADAEAALHELESARRDIDAQVAAGILGQMEGEEALLQIEIARLDALERLAAAMLAAAEATGDPEKIAAAQDFAASIREIEYSVEGSVNAFARLGEVALDAAQSALADFLDTGIEGAEDLGDAFQEMGAAVVQALRRIVAEMMAAWIIKKITGLFSMGGEVGGDGGGSGGEPATAEAAIGGLFRGKGTGTSDSNIIAVSDHEFIVRAAVVKQPGVLAHLRELNREGHRVLGTETPRMINAPIGRFAEGGLVETGGVSGEVLNGRLEVGLEEGLVMRELESPQGQRILVNTLKNNRRAVRSALGI